MNSSLHIVVTAILLVFYISAFATKPTQVEMAQRNAWSVKHFGDGKSVVPLETPFSFIFDGKPSSEFLATWTKSCSSKKLSKKRTQKTVTYTDPQTGLVVTCQAVEYGDYPTVEWTLKFKNTGKVDTPILTDIRALDINFNRTKTDEFKLHWNTADNCSVDSYALHVDTLRPNAEFKSASAGGRPTTGGYPYWNVEFDGGGAIVVLSWGGQWSAQYKRDDKTQLSIKAGQELTHFTLHPGEEVTSPLAIVQFYQGNAVRAQNIWRRWMLAHNTPRFKGKVPGSMIGMTACGYADGYRSNIEFEKLFIDRYVREKMGLTFWNHDAGWYPCDPDGWWKVGTWEPDLKRYPKGIKEESDYVHKFGMDQMLWFEPERVAKGTWLAENHPEWIYGGADGGLVKLSNPDAWKWIVERIDSLIKSQGVDIYRQDFNIDPLGYWRGNDTPDRQGITEIRHIESYYAYWDELLRRNPGLLIDSCASGGRRNNVETLRRSIFVLRTDFEGDALGNQVHTYGLSSWVSVQGTGVFLGGEYESRCGMVPIFGLAYDVRKPDCDWALARRLVKEWREVAPNLLGDFYPLTPFSLDEVSWIGWQFDLPEKGKGSVHVFRRPKNGETSKIIKLQGLEAGASYKLKSYDGHKTVTVSGKDLMEKGIRVEIKAQPGSALFAYQKSQS